MTDESTSKEKEFTIILTVTGAILLYLIYHYRLSFSLNPSTTNMPQNIGIFILSALASITNIWFLDVPHYGRIPMAAPVYYAAVILFGPPVTSIIILLSGLAKTVYALISKFGKIFDIYRETVGFIISFGTGGIIYALNIKGSFFLSGTDTLRNIFVLILSSLIIFLLNHILSVSERIIINKINISNLFVINSRSIKVHMVMLLPLGLLVATIFSIEPKALILLAPVYIMYLSMKNYAEVLKEARLTIEDLAIAYESRDPYNKSHSQNVAVTAGEIAKSMNLREEEIDKIISAAKLHDLGKIGIADQILEKGKFEALSFEDYEEIRKHPEMGHRVTHQLSWYKDEAQYIYHHHEWYDGSGYPKGLQGEAIPLGARIIAVAEAFDSMVSPRAYRDPIPLEIIIEELKKKRGIQFDPNVIDSFIGLVEKKK